MFSFLQRPLVLLLLVYSMPAYSCGVAERISAKFGDYFDIYSRADAPSFRGVEGGRYVLKGFAALEHASLLHGSSYDSTGLLVDGNIPSLVFSGGEVRLEHWRDSTEVERVFPAGWAGDVEWKTRSLTFHLEYPTEIALLETTKDSNVKLATVYCRIPSLGSLICMVETTRPIAFLLFDRSKG